MSNLQKLPKGERLAKRAAYARREEIGRLAREAMLKEVEDVSQLFRGFRKKDPEFGIKRGPFDQPVDRVVAELLLEGVAIEDMHVELTSRGFRGYWRRDIWPSILRLL